MAREETFEYADKYVFFSEWYNEIAEVIKPFLLSFYPHDQTLELYDLKYNRMFLRRTNIEGITLSCLFKGAIVNIFSRQIHIVSYANKWTEKVYEEALQKIFTVIKPDAVSRLGSIICFLERNGYKLINIKMGRMTNEGVQKFLSISCTEPLPHDLTKTMTNGPSVAIEAIGERGFSRWLEAVGPDNPDLAKLEAPDSLRAKLGSDLLKNAVHANPKEDGQILESRIWFIKEAAIHYIEPTCRLLNSTCCVIKPHALHECLVGDILTCIEESGFQILALEMFYLDRASAEEFYEVYKGVIPEYSSMVTQLASGPCIALEITHISDPESTSTIFRQLVGPSDPAIARELQPHSVRAKFGKSTVNNAVHCTDLPDDAKLEYQHNVLRNIEYKPTESTKRQNKMNRKRKESKKCQSLSSPRAFKGFPRGKCIRAEALGWAGWKDTSLEANRSFPAEYLTSGAKMDWFRGDGLNLASFSNRKWAFNQSPIHLSSSRDESWLNETSLNMSTHPSNTHFDGPVPLPNTSKAVFTILIPSAKILIVNSVACKLLGFTAEELCAMTLKELVQDPQQLFTAGFDSLDSVTASSSLGNGSVVELSTRDGIRIPVFLFFKKIETPQRCVAVAELVDRRVATVTIDSEERIVGFDEEVTTMFQFDSVELSDLYIKDLIPSATFSDYNSTDNCIKLRITGRTKIGISFPLCMIARRVAVTNGWHIVLRVYSNLSGVIVLNQDLSIANCNNLFTTLLFGYSKENLMKQSILKLLPGFCEDGEYGRDRTVTADRSDLSNSDPIPDQQCPRLSEDNEMESESATSCTVSDVCLETVPSDEYLEIEISNSTQDCARLMDDLIIESPGEDDSSSGIIRESDLELQNEMTEKLSNLNKGDFKIWHSETRLRSSRSDDVLAKSRSPNKMQVTGACSILDLEGTGLKQYPMNRALNMSNLSDLEGEKDVRPIKEGTFAGRGRHKDGADIDVVYRVREARGRKGYCVCVARDPWEAAEGGRGLPPNLTITSSFNSTSMDGSLTKDSEINSRPNSASIISQSDDVLTSGEYCEFYTNLQQIGKGAFGYVKMAYRNGDGLLVITKFIKKHKIHVRSWVVDPTLKMKVPLEISLLTTLEHPHIVRVLDVFHNEAFFQLVMEKHGAGMDLFEFIDRKPKLDEKLGSYIFRQMVSAIHYLHSLGILHRDIKDENVIINEDFHVKLIDFGSAAFMTPDRLFSTFYGTVEYCSPEVLQGNKYKGPELEVWALGVTLFVLTFGENPFYDVEETIKGEFVIPRPISSQLFSLIKGMLEKDIAVRWEMDKIVEDAWVNIPVDPTTYSFQKVVRCYHDEAYPSKYISEYAKEELGREEEDEDRTVASSNSFCSLHTIENLDESEQYHPPDCHVSFNGKKNEDSLLVPSSQVLSSTPRRITNTKTVSCTNNAIDSSVEQARKRFSLDLNTLKKLCDVDREARRVAENVESTDILLKSEYSDSGENCRLEFFDSFEQRQVDDFESYWDAEDENYELDSY